MRLAIVCLLGLTAHALADSKTDAQRFYNDGQIRYRAGDYAAAAELFRAAWEHDHDPVYLFNTAQAYRFAKACATSADYYKQFLAAAPAAPNRDKVQQWIDEMTACATPQALEPLPPEPARPARSEPAGAGKRYAGIALGAAGLVGVAFDPHRIRSGCLPHVEPDQDQEQDVAPGEDDPGGSGPVDDGGHRAHQEGRDGQPPGEVHVRSGRGPAGRRSRATNPPWLPPARPPGG